MAWWRASTMSVVMTVPRGMFTLAYTVGSSVGAEEAGAWRLLKSTITPPKATTASRIPMRRTRRLDRFKANTPEWCDRWHHDNGDESPREHILALGVRLLSSAGRPRRPAGTNGLFRRRRLQSHHSGMVKRGFAGLV